MIKIRPTLAKIILASGLLLPLLLSMSAQASPYGFNKYNLFNYLEASYLNTNSNFDNAGNSQTLAAGSQFKEIKVNLLSSYDITDWFGAFSNITFKRNESNTSTINRYNSNISDVELGADAMAWSGFVNIVPEASISLPTTGGPGSDGSVLLGDSATTYGGKLNVSKVWKSVSTMASFGIRFRNQGYSTQLPWKFAAHYEIDQFFFDGTIHGISSLNDDTYSSTPQTRNAVNNLYDAGSLIYNGVNPSWTRASVRAAYRFDEDLFVSFGVEQTIMGINSHQGTQFLLGVGLNQLVGAPHKRLRELRVLTPAKDIPDNKRFKENTKEEEEILPPEDFTIKRVKVKKTPINPSR